ncbi:hypothetical protein ACLOJK_000301 [Asimina triloba]
MEKRTATAQIWLLACGIVGYAGSIMAIEIWPWSLGDEDGELLAGVGEEGRRVCFGARNCWKGRAVGRLVMGGGDGSPGV